MRRSKCKERRPAGKASSFPIPPQDERADALLDAVGVAQRLLREAGAYARLRAHQDPRTKDYERLSFEQNEALVCARVCIGAALRAEEDESC